jgi:hypothetical protein
MVNDLKSRVLAQVQAQPAPTRQASQIHAWLVLPSSTILGAVLFFAFDGVHHGQGRPIWFHAVSVAVWTLVAAVSMWAALARGGSPLGRTSGWLTTVAAGTPAVLLVMMLAFALFHPEVTLLHPERIGYKCFGLALAGAAFPLIALTALLRSSDPVHPRATGAALGAACGASSGVMVELWCPVAAPRHVLVGHVLPIVILTFLGATFASRVIAIRYVRLR